MRKCLRCEAEMKGNFDVKVEGAAYEHSLDKTACRNAFLEKRKTAPQP